ncbi:MAG: hypothetical protein QOE61_3546, partial [Micromonosporaceae bacterium]|nr:hypothetical protein [Micromonosporaceae bacterium]
QRTPDVWVKGGQRGGQFRRADPEVVAGDAIEPGCRVDDRAGPTMAHVGDDRLHHLQGGGNIDGGTGQ